MAPVINKKDMVEESEAVEEKEDHVVCSCCLSQEQEGSLHLYDQGNEQRCRGGRCQALINIKSAHPAISFDAPVIGKGQIA